MQPEDNQKLVDGKKNIELQKSLELKTAMI